MQKNTPIGARLREARVSAGFSQKMLGIVAGIDEFSASARINQYERGKHAPDYITAENLATALIVPTAFFYAREDDLAEMLLLFSRLPAAEKQTCIAQLKRLHCEIAGCNP